MFKINDTIFKSIILFYNIITFTLITDIFFINVAAHTVRNQDNSNRNLITLSARTQTAANGRLLCSFKKVLAIGDSLQVNISMTMSNNIYI